MHHFKTKDDLLLALLERRDADSPGQRTGTNDLVADVPQVAASDDDRGETVKALVVLRAEARGSAQAGDIIAWAREHMAAYKVPRSITRFDELPRSMVGKVLRREVRDELVRRRQKGTT